LGTHAAAVEEAVAERKDGLTAADKPLIELARSLAREMDTANYERGTRLYASYLTTVRELTRRLAQVPRDTGPSALDRMRAERGRPAPSKKTKGGRAS
jgi:predicted nuclease with RNAse H fold